MRFKQPLYFVALVLASFSLASCGSSSSDKVNNSDDFKEAEKDSLSQRIEHVMYNIPKPTEIPYQLQATGAEFNPVLVNKKDNADKYLSVNDKAAMNLGVYAADVGYLASYEKTQEAINHLSACKVLAENLNIIGSFDVEVLQKFEANISNKDSLSALVDATMRNTDAFLKDSNRNKLSALVITGSFVEGLYIATGIIKSYPKNLLKDEDRKSVLMPLTQLILKQKSSVSELAKMLSAVEQSESVTSLLTDMKSLETAYSTLNLDQQIKDKRADLVLTDKGLADITTIIEKVRKDITD